MRKHVACMCKPDGTISTPAARTKTHVTCSPRQVQAARSYMHMTVGLQCATLLLASRQHTRAREWPPIAPREHLRSAGCILSCRLYISRGCELRSAFLSVLSKTIRYVSLFMMSTESTLLSGHMPKWPFPAHRPASPSDSSLSWPIGC